MCSAQSISKKMLHRLHPAEQSVWAQIHVCRVTDLEKNSVRISKDEAPMPLSVVGSLFVFPLSFHLSQALLGVWPFGLFCCVYSSFHNMLDLIRVFYWVFYFPNLSVFVSSYVKMMTNRVIVLPWVGGLYWNCHVHLSRALLGAWRFGLFCCVYSSFHNRLDLIRDPAFYWVFYFHNLTVFVSSYVIHENVLFILFLVQ